MTKALSLAAEQVEMLNKPTPKDFIMVRPGPGGKNLNYVQTGYVIAQLNKIFGNVWTFEVVRESQQEDQVWVLGRLRVMLEDGVVLTKEQYGSAGLKKNRTTGNPVSLGDDFKAAASDSLKKCSSLLGLCSDVYHPELHKTVERLKGKIEKESQTFDELIASTT